MLREEGVPSEEEIKEIEPPSYRCSRGAVVWVECFEEIPCDPCYDACPVDAFAKFEDINDTPIVDHDKCTGCGICVASCPGLAIFVVDETYSEDEGLVALPYEFKPLPQKDEEVILRNRAGEQVGTGEIVRIQNPSSFDRTAVVWVAVPKDLVREVRAIEKGAPVQ